MCFAAVIFFPKCYCHLMQKAPSLCDDSYDPLGVFCGGGGDPEASFKYTFEPTLSVMDPSADRVCGSVELDTSIPNGGVGPEYIAIVHFNDDQRRRPYGLQCTKFSPSFRDAEDYELCPVHDWRTRGNLGMKNYVRWQDSLDLLWGPADSVEIINFRLTNGGTEYLMRFPVEGKRGRFEWAPEQVGKTAFIKDFAVDKNADWLEAANAYHRYDEGYPSGKKKWPLRDTQNWTSFITRSRRGKMSMEQQKNFLFHKDIEDPSKNPVPEQSRKRKRSLALEDRPLTLENPPLTLDDPPSSPENPPSTLSDRPLALEAHRSLPRQNPPSPLEEQPSMLEEQRSMGVKQRRQAHRRLPRKRRPSPLKEQPLILEKQPSTLEEQLSLLQAHRPLLRQNSSSPLEEQRSTLEEQLSLLQEHRPLPREPRTSLLENPPWTLDDLPSTSENQSMLLDFFLSEFEPQQKEKASQQDIQTEGTVPPV